MTTLTNAHVTSAPVTHVAEPTRRRSTSPATNVEEWSSPLVTKSQRDFLNDRLAVYGAAKLRPTHATESVARKAIRVALRDSGVGPKLARDIATLWVAASREV